ncbi:MAG TPA: dTDP-4-dehydrorhamnose 3,5-epimerase family protein [Candidatus Omnitrophota bacterium]|nr:dTDP-4-dehydrorhamnose 3,5-epimerase family protein [Candidatus Omnitrophota bacterium]
MIKGVIIEKLKEMNDERGSVKRMLRCDAPYFERFGEIYFSTVNPGFIKGWKKHLKQTQHFAVPVGVLQLVIYDDRADSSTKGEVQEIRIGEGNYQLVRIPPNVWYSFKAKSTGPAMIANCTDMPHNPKESVQLEISDPSIPYSWD